MLILIIVVVRSSSGEYKQPQPQQQPVVSAPTNGLAVVEQQNAVAAAFVNGINFREDMAAANGSVKHTNLSLLNLIALHCLKPGQHELLPTIRQVSTLMRCRVDWAMSESHRGLIAISPWKSIHY